MITGRNCFNIYLLVALSAVLACGCQTHKKEEKPLATLRLHLEASGDATDQTVAAPVYRANPVLVTVEKEPFLTEANVAGAKVVNVMGGFDLQVQFDRQGTWLLENYSASNPGRHFAIFSQFGKKKGQGRWLAAPKFTKLISNGVIQFTPDATREEAGQIVIGLSNTAQIFQKKSKW